MKRLIVLLPFSFLGGLVTFSGGLLGDVELSVLLIRSLFAMVISSIILSGLAFLLSRALFQGIDLFAHTVSKKEHSSNNQENIPQEQLEEQSFSNSNQDMTDENRHSNTENRAGVSHMANTIEREANIRSISSTLEEQLRSADSKELANIVRHSMNEE